MTSELNDLIDGYQKFKERYADEKAYFDSLVTNGQNPKALVIACSDSRVDPAILTQSKPGELFMVRNVANLVPPYEADPRHHGTSAALEFAVLGLGINDIIIMGHRYCGGVRALMENEPHDGQNCFINTWMNIARPAKAQVLKEHPDDTIETQAHFCEKASLLVSLENLKTFPWVQERIKQGTLNVHAWYFDLETGTLYRYAEEEKTFQPL